MIDALGNDFYDHDILLLIRFQEVCTAISIGSGLSSVDGTPWIHITEGIASWFLNANRETGIFDMLVKTDLALIPPTSLGRCVREILEREGIISSPLADFTAATLSATEGDSVAGAGVMVAGDYLDALGRPLRIGDFVAIRKGAKFAGSGIVVGFRGSFVLVENGGVTIRKSSKFLTIVGR